jgi:hypothetical protein
LAARLLLVALIGWLVAGEIWPAFRLAKVWLAADQVTHIIIVYALTLFAAAAFTRTHVGLVALGVACLGSALELGQYLGLVQGNAQFHDFIANAIGAASAALPLWIGRSSASGANVRPAEDDTAADG